ncbi:MAG TPA: UDP-N-acetylmuramate--L-alanine ligase, partial [Thermomicrobiales bacterium]|nr:UDP-N-acetylmuramate--L-alanine ligase [Thermomicrobiales bacterium]
MSQLSGLPSLPAAVHFVGIGGIGMSGLARILQTWGYTVSGSDAFPSQLVDQLQEEGIPVTIGHEDVSRAQSADLIVATAALRPTNTELQAARQANIPIVKRAELLGMLMNSRLGIAVAGSHGKSSTSGMVVTAMMALQRAPSYAIGAIVQSEGTNAAPGDGAAMIVEADEYDYSFLWLKPQIAIITNVDYDHPDLFPDQDAYDRAFLRFTLGIRPGGTLILNGDDAGVQRLLPQLQRADLQVVTYGERSGADWTIAGSIVRAPDGREVRLNLQVPGRHNIGNATAALIAMESLGAPVGEGAAALGTYTGVARRFEIKAEVGGVTIVDDYAHHPQEIAATIQAARSRYPDRRLVIAFQPHTYSRTKALASAFAEALTAADVPMVLNIYAA